MIHLRHFNTIVFNSMLNFTIRLFNRFEDLHVSEIGYMKAQIPISEYVGHSFRSLGIDNRSSVTMCLTMQEKLTISYPISRPRTIGIDNHHLNNV